LTSFSAVIKVMLKEYFLGECWEYGWLADLFHLYVMSGCITNFGEA